MKKKCVVFLIISFMIITVITLLMLQEKKQNNKDYIFKDTFKLSDIQNDNFYFSIEKNYKDCIPILLEIYSDEKYGIRSKYFTSSVNNIAIGSLSYDEPVIGKYSFDIEKIFLSIKKTNRKEYIIHTGNQKEYFTDSDNKALIDFLNSIEINLDKCAEEIIK